MIKIMSGQERGGAETKAAVDPLEAHALFLAGWLRGATGSDTGNGRGRA